MATTLNAKSRKCSNDNQFFKGDLGFDKNNNKFIIYKILTEKKLEVCKIIIDEKNNKIEIATKTSIIHESEIQIYSFALEHDTAQYILKIIHEMKMQWEIEFLSDQINKEEEYYVDEYGVTKKRKKKTILTFNYS